MKPQPDEPVTWRQIRIFLYSVAAVGAVFVWGAAAIFLPTWETRLIGFVGVPIVGFLSVIRVVVAEI